MDWPTDSSTIRRSGKAKGPAREFMQKLHGLLEATGRNLLVVLEVYRRHVALDRVQRALSTETAHGLGWHCAVALDYSA